jgi:UPF0042 nucleotide-binding protein
MPPQTIHATALAAPAWGASPSRAVLLLGPSGSGKSDLALRLIDRGWQLIADDRTALSVADGRLMASAPPAIAGLIEVRGVGIRPKPAHPGPVGVALVLDLAQPPERLPDPHPWQAAGHAHAPIPCLGFDPASASAPLRLEHALQAHGLPPNTAPMLPDSAPPSPKPLLAVSGLSGAGKSTALKALEDLGYEVVDNLPLALVDALIASPQSSNDRPLAFGIDSRTRAFDAEALVERLRSLKQSGTDVRLIYLDCADEELVRRFSETRRRHPLAQDRPAADGIAQERLLTEPLRRWADLVIDTSDFSVADLRRRITERLGQEDSTRLTITLQSFGFAGGLPRNADLVFDMRFLANPHWEPALRPLTGLDAPVQAHVHADPAYAPAVDRIADLLQTLIPGYGREGKAYLTIAIGCTGGRHRSVTVALDIQARLQAAGHAVTLIHRDLDRGAKQATGRETATTEQTKP